MGLMLPISIRMQYAKEMTVNTCFFPIRLRTVQQCVHVRLYASVVMWQRRPIKQELYRIAFLSMLKSARVVLRWKVVQPYHKKNVKCMRKV